MFPFTDIFWLLYAIAVYGLCRFFAKEITYVSAIFSPTEKEIFNLESDFSRRKIQREQDTLNHVARRTCQRSEDSWRYSKKNNSLPSFRTILRNIKSMDTYFISCVIVCVLWQPVKRLEFEAHRTRTYHVKSNSVSILIITRFICSTMGICLLLVREEDEKGERSTIGWQWRMIFRNIHNRRRIAFTFGLSNKITYVPRIWFIFFFISKRLCLLNSSTCYFSIGIHFLDTIGTWNERKRNKVDNGQDRASKLLGKLFRFLS